MSSHGLDCGAVLTIGVAERAQEPSIDCWALYRDRESEGLAMQDAAPLSAVGRFLEPALELDL